MRLSQWPQCLQSKTRYPQCKPAKAGRQPAQNGAKSPRSLSIGAAFGAWLVPGDRRPAGLAVELAVSTQAMAAALARHLVGCALADWCLPLPWASWAHHKPAGHSAGAVVPSLLALPLLRSRARWARGGGGQKSDECNSETDLSTTFTTAGNQGRGVGRKPG